MLTQPIIFQIAYFLSSDWKRAPIPPCPAALPWYLLNVIHINMIYCGLPLTWGHRYALNH